MAYSEDKKRISLFASEDLVQRIDDSLYKTDFKSRNEFILEAIKFYLGYLYSEEDATYFIRSVKVNMRNAQREA